MNTTKTTKSVKKTKKPLASHFAVRRGFKIAALCGLLLFITAQLAFDVTVVRRQNAGDDTAIISLIEQAVDNLKKPAAVDPASGTVYLTEARLKLPPPADPYVQVLYSYSAGDSAADAQVQLTTQQAVGVAKSQLWTASANGSAARSDQSLRVFNQVPHLQACSRGITVLFSAKAAADYQVKPENIKQLKDGRTLYFATDDVAQCGSSLSSFVEYVKQVESY